MRKQGYIQIDYDLWYVRGSLLARERRPLSTSHFIASAIGIGICLGIGLDTCAAVPGSETSCQSLSSHHVPRELSDDKDLEVDLEAVHVCQFPHARGAWRNLKCM
jgi:hypothetical protein